jgi:biliverdin reductase
MRWAVVGVGVAGRARCRAIAEDPRASLVAVWRGRFAAAAGAPIAADLSAAIAAADAVAIASPTGLHAAQARAVLEAGRHALVELPLAVNADDARALFALARERDRVLHVAHIELLTPVAAALRAEFAPGDVEEAAIEFDAPGRGDEPPETLAIGNVARLMRLIDCCGPVDEVSPLAAPPGSLAADLHLRAGAIARLRFRAGPGLARATRMRIRAAGRTWSFDTDALAVDGQPVPLPPAGGLFAADQRIATARVLDGAPGYVGEGAIAHGLDLAESLSKPVRSPIRCHETLRGT